MSVGTFSRLAIAVFLSAMAGIVAAPAAFANQDAEAFTQRVIDEGISILRTNGHGEDPRHTKFHNFIVKYADATSAAMFTLGPYRRGASKADINSFVDAYREYEFALYARSLEKYKDKTLHVTGSVDNKPGDVTVATVVQDGGSSSDKALRIAFRLLGSEGSFKFADVQIEGAWISQSQLEQFRAILSRNGGNIADLTREIEQQTDRIISGGDRPDHD